MLRAAGRRPAVGRIVRIEFGVDLVVEPQALADRHELGAGQLLDLVGGVARFEVGPEQPALDRLGQDDGRAALVLDAAW